jgi:hypothetical protein
LIISIFTVSIVYCQLTTSQQAENTLVTCLFKNYSRSLRPDALVNILVSIQLKQIISLDEKNQPLFLLHKNGTMQDYLGMYLQMEIYRL